MSMLCVFLNINPGEHICKCFPCITVKKLKAKLLCCRVRLFSTLSDNTSLFRYQPYMRDVVALPPYLHLGLSYSASFVVRGWEEGKQREEWYLSRLLFAFSRLL